MTVSELKQTVSELINIESNNKKQLNTRPLLLVHFQKIQMGINYVAGLETPRNWSPLKAGPFLTTPGGGQPIGLKKAAGWKTAAGGPTPPTAYR